MNSHSCICNFRIERKEFSNDPTAEMQEISNTFQSNVSSVQFNLSKLKDMSEKNPLNSGDHAQVRI
jgi:hypothetical protein